MHKDFIKTAALLGAIAVVLGAFGAHALRQVAKDDALNIFETAVRYQFYHVFALLCTGILYREFSNKLLRWSGMLFITGMVLFCGSLYLLTYLKINAIEGYNWFGAVTPVGGLCFILGWICLFAGMFKK